MLLDAAKSEWPPWAADASYDIVLMVNLLHISPAGAAVVKAAMRGAATAVRVGGLVIAYGPFLVEGKPTTPSNAEFDASLKSMNAAFGLRDVADVCSAAASAGLSPVAQFEMPANNFILAFLKESR